MHRNNKQKYYLFNYLKLLIPDFYFRLRLNHKLKKITKSDFDYIKLRVDYYNKLDKKVCLPDETPKLKSFKIKKLKYFLSKTHTTLYAARNLAMQKTRGEYISFIDADDMWEKNKLRKQISHKENINKFCKFIKHLDRAVQCILVLCLCKHATLPEHRHRHRGAYASFAVCLPLN